MPAMIHLISGGHWFCRDDCRVRQKEDAFSALRDAIDEGYRTSVISDQWTLPFDPYLAVLRDDPRFDELLLELQELNDDMYERVLEAEASGEWQVLLDMAGAS